MAETVITSAEPNTNPDGLLDHPAPSDNGSLFHSKLEFHIAKKPFTGFSNGGGDFRLETLNPSSDSHSPRLGSNQGSGSLAPGGMKPDTSEILENGLDPEFSFGITFRRIGAGLENLGNTCFLNSVLQCLTYTEPLAAYLQSGRHQNSCRTAGFCALCAIQKHVSRALQSTGRILAPKDLVSNLRCISRSFRNSRQEDAHEYMVNLLESMHKCCLPSGVPSESPSAYEKSLVHKIFGGRIRSQVKCMQCSFCSNKFDPFVDLSLEIVNADSLYKALALFTAKEQLDGGEKQYQCQQCKQKVKALKQLTVHKAPYVLTIHLKRFGPHALGQKIDKKVQFGRTLDLRSFVTGPYGGDLKYTLYGVLVHAGWSTHSGHYYCFVRTSSGMWYSLDDNQVVQVNERIVLEQKAYMLFYVRDRRNVAQKKPIDVVQKENMVIHAMGNQTHSNSNQGLNETIQSGPSDKKDHVKGLSFPTLNGEEGLPQSSPSIGGSNDILKLDNSTIMKTTAKIIDFQQEESYKKDPSDSLSISPKCNGTQRSAEDLCIAEKTCQMIVKEASSKDPDRKASERNDSVRSLTRTGDEDCQIRGLSNGSAVGDSSSEKAGDIGQRTGKNELVDLSQSVLQTKARDRKYHKELKKKLHKCRVASIHLGPNILLGASLGPRRKKKKHKKSKHQTLKIKNLSEEHFLNRVSLSTDLRPSTSEINRKVSLNDSAYSTRKKTKSGLDEKYNSAAIKNGTTSNVDSLMGVINEEFRERVDPNRAVLANDKPPQKCSDSVSAGNQMDDRGTNSPDDRRRDSVQNGFMNMLTRGLEETIVARWDGTEMPPSQARDSGFGSFSIGYIGDERDEEYDCGKRKKVRSSKNSFGGPNPFQEIARKKAKMDQSSSGDRPFRI